MTKARGVVRDAPPDVITSVEAVEQLGIGYHRLRNWWQRNWIHSWEVGGRVLVSKGEVRRELHRRDGLRKHPASMRPGRRVQIAALPGAPETPTKAPAHMPLALPELPGAEWTPGGPWGYTSR